MKKWFFPAAIALAAAIVSIVTYANLPETMIVHFNSKDQPNNWMGKEIGAFLMPVLIIFVSSVTIIANKFEKDENKRRRVEASLGSILSIVAITFFIVHAFIIAYNLGYEISAAMIATLTVGIVFLFMGNIVPRLPQGSFQYPKLPDEIQRKASRFQGRFMIVMGIGFLLLSMLPGESIFPVFFGLFTLFIIVTIGSLIHYSRH